MTHGGFKGLLKDRGFHAFLWTPFLEAFHDNVYKIFVSMRAVHAPANSESSSPGVPDQERGERLAFYTRPDMTPGDLWRALSESELAKPWLPKRENIRQIDALPTLGTGKPDWMAGKSKAQQLAASPVAE